MRDTINDSLEWINLDELDITKLSARKTKSIFDISARPVDEIKMLRAKTKTLWKCLSIMAVVLGLLISGIIGYFNSTVEKYKVELVKSITAQNELEIEVEHSTKEYEDKLFELTEYSKKVTEQNEQLTNDYNELLEVNKELAKRAELYDKYSYAIQGDITLEQIAKLDELCKTSAIGDTDFILAFALVESRGIANAANQNSTAKGYGQFLNGTSKFVYTDLLGYDNWKPEVAYDPDINFEMMVAYFDYLYNATGSLEGAITAYRGGYNPAYLSEINKKLALAGKSITSISTDCKTK